MGFIIIHSYTNIYGNLNMDWEKKLKELNGYNISFEIKQGYYHIALTYDNEWNILTPDNEFIYLEERNGIYHYIASTDNVKIEDIFNAIDATIVYNMDLQKKLTLFRQKTEELQELFSKEDYETLQTIEFKITKKEVKKKTIKKTKKKDKEKTKKNIVKKKQKKEVQEVKDTTKEIVENNLNHIETTDYDKNDDVVIMSNDYFEELERK